jgi:3-phosphoshikimate 1-carboxyvinyltransferase
MTRSIAYREVGGEATAPASKSSMQRATACALLALSGGRAEPREPAARLPDEPSILRSPSRSADCMAALKVAAALGATVSDLGDRFEIRGSSEAALRDASSRSLSCGESGLCIRMFSPVAALFSGETELRAEGSLRARRADMIAAPLADLGASCETGAGGLPPVRLRGPLRGGRAKVDGRESSQLLTGLLVALPLAERDSALEVEGLASRGYVDLTLDTMRAFGVEAERDPGYERFAVRGSQRYRPTDFHVEGDWSGGAFFLAAAAMASGAEGLLVRGLDPESSQPDRAMLEALRLCGASVELDAAGIRVRRNQLRAFEFDATDCPDLFPPLAALASACTGTTTLRGAKRLAGKESDRAAALSEELGALGATILVEGDLMRVSGCGLASSGTKRLPGGRADSRGDHRIAMAAALASLACSGPVEISNPECVSKSWPSFFEDLGSIAR